MYNGFMKRKNYILSYYIMGLAFPLILAVIAYSGSEGRADFAESEKMLLYGWRHLGPQWETRKRNETELIHPAFPLKLLPKDFLETSRNIR